MPTWRKIAADVFWNLTKIVKNGKFLKGKNGTLFCTKPTLNVFFSWALCT